MTDQNLTDLLERAADRTHVGPPPLDDMLVRTRHVRRRRAVLLTAAASAALVVVVGGTAALSGPRSNPQRDPATADTSVAPSATTESSTLALNGTWTVRALVGLDGQSVLAGPHADRVEMTFKDGEVSGTTGCNDVFGTYHQSGDQGQDLVFPHTQLGSTLVGCSDEPPLVTRLLDVRHISGSGDVRYLHAADWMIVAELRRQTISGRGSVDETCVVHLTQGRETVDAPLVGPARPLRFAQDEPVSVEIQGTCPSDLEVTPASGTTSSLQLRDPAGPILLWDADDTHLVLSHQPCLDAEHGGTGCRGPHDLMVYPVDFSS